MVAASIMAALKWEESSYFERFSGLQTGICETTLKFLLFAFHKMFTGGNQRSKHRALSQLTPMFHVEHRGFEAQFCSTWNICTEIVR